MGKTSFTTVSLGCIAAANHQAVRISRPSRFTDGPIHDVWTAHRFYAAQTLPYSADAVPEETTANTQTEKEHPPQCGSKPTDPLNSLVLSALVAAVPIILFLLGSPS